MSDIVVAGITLADWLVYLIAPITIGAARAGLPAINLIAVPILVLRFGGAPTAGLILPLLVIADIPAVIHYGKGASRKDLVRLLPWAALGILAGTFVGRAVPDEVFRILIGVIILVAAVLMGWREVRRQTWKPPEGRLYGAGFGLAGGFATMIGNSAGPLMALYMITMGLDKVTLIGTQAVFFFLVNISKLPIHAFVWGTITPQTLLIDLIMAPFAIGSFYLVKPLVKKIPEKPFRFAVIVAVMIGAARLLIPVST